MLSSWLDLSSCPLAAGRSAAALQIVTISCGFALILFRPGSDACLRQNVRTTSVPELSGLPVWELWLFTVSGQKKAAGGGWGGGGREVGKRYLGDKTGSRMTRLTGDVCLVIRACLDQTLGTSEPGEVLEATIPTALLSSWGKHGPERM